MQFKVGIPVYFAHNVWTLESNRHLRRYMRVYTRKNWTMTVLACEHSLLLIRLFDDEPVWLSEHLFTSAPQHHHRPADVTEAQALAELESCGA